MNVIRARVQQRDHRQSNAMRPRVIRIDVHVPSGAPPRFEEQAVVALRAAIVILSDVSEVRLRIREIEDAALRNVSRR